MNRIPKDSRISALGILQESDEVPDSHGEAKEDCVRWPKPYFLVNLCTWILPSELNRVLEVYGRENPIARRCLSSASPRVNRAKMRGSGGFHLRMLSSLESRLNLEIVRLVPGCLPDHSGGWRQTLRTIC